MERKVIVIQASEGLWYCGTDSKHERIFLSRKLFHAKKFATKSEARATIDELGFGYLAEYVRGGETTNE